MRIISSTIPRQALIVLFSCLILAHASVLESSWAVSPHRPIAYHEVIDANRRWVVKQYSNVRQCPGEFIECFPGARRRNVERDITENQLITRVKMWPPWPLSLLQRDNDDNHHYDKGSKEDQGVTAANTYPSAAAVAFAWCSQRARIGVRQLQEVGSSLWFHLPPSLPPLLAAACVPRKVETGRLIPLFKDPFARTLILGGFGIAVLSWAHQELHRKRKLTPLVGVPLPVSRVFLPPFLPEMVPEPEIEALQQTTSEFEDDRTAEDSSQILSMLSPRFRKHLSDIYESSPLKHDNPLRFRGFFKEWRRKQEVRKREAAKIRRSTIFDQLVALQAIKRKSKARRWEPSNSYDLERGYALVTGASQGIGRALAVELARWEIPLVLVARDVDRLTSLAYDLEACYGVRCCVLQADLSQLDAPERIYETTKEAGLTIDILVNNAGVAYEGLATDMDTSVIEQMIVINAVSFAKLSKLYGQDMKERGRGRMLMVSSMAGVASASPNTAMYGATKAFEKSLSLSMSKELESHGVGVTCIMPGPVTDTAFRVRSGTARALCWYIPFLPRPAETVAHQGIMSLLDGDTQVIPGWQNRAFVQLFRPVLPQRVETMCVEAAWSPFRFPSFKALIGINPPSQTPTLDTQDGNHGLIDTSPPDSQHLDLRPRYSFQMPPRLLELPIRELVIDGCPAQAPMIPEGESETPDVQRQAETVDSSEFENQENNPARPPTTTSNLPQDGTITITQTECDVKTLNETVSNDESLDHLKPLLKTMNVPSDEIDDGWSRVGQTPGTSAGSRVGEQEDTCMEMYNSSMPAQALRTQPGRPQTNNAKGTNKAEGANNDDNENEDSTLSPRLGPIDLLRDSRPFTSLPNSKTAGRRKWNVEA